MTIATATVKGGMYEQLGLTQLVSMQGSGPAVREINQLLSRKGMRDMRRKMFVLDGVVAGSSAVEQPRRIEANVELGGKRVIEAETLVNRNTTAADVTEINTDLLNSLTSKTTLASPVNKDGNPLGTR